MSDFWDDVLELVGAAAPALATALGGPFAGVATKFVADQLLGKPDAGQEEVKTALVNATPDQMIRLKELDADFKLKMQQAGVDMTRLMIEKEVAFLKNQENARQTFGGSRGVFWMGVAILSVFAVLMGMVLWGCYMLLTQQVEVSKVDAGLLATATGMVGTIIGYAAANAQQVVGFFYGSSQGSAEKTEALGNAVAKFGSAVANSNR